MRVRFKEKHLIVSAESAAEREEIAAHAAVRNGHVFHLTAHGDKGFALEDLGVRADALEEPLNISSRIPDPMLRPISNLAFTPFELDGQAYASVEGFWQGLKTEDPGERTRIAALWGAAAKFASAEFPAAYEFHYLGKKHRVGRWEHWHLMYRACAAKFTQNAEARNALLLTGRRCLEHRMRRDSDTIPGIVMADIWMRVRREIQQGRTAGAGPDAGS